LYYEEEQRHIFGKAGRESIAKEFDWENISPRAELMYRGVIDGGCS